MPVSSNARVLAEEADAGKMQATQKRTLQPIPISSGRADRPFRNCAMSRYELDGVQQYVCAAAGNDNQTTATLNDETHPN
mmetsp:Transcript_2330/g.6156  ORF Transcript_2330/g.6156 Transcript_2330/m.6156 type:complete len:80 (-) Transcript_2330:547-786(-)|eukprot:CAMPEP_0113533870 /NCGR_PEP_ID=MMETSP0015_2-20120614/4854_1 /TAXON_ID=2838 /ORGANISM="Odontella" /LENGTH=79 /DNA_ID=CAMNT_0000432989 /DNA_START=249 /DNA_END=488 /DNA_ORIENTATION=+ /assembly_acc=CAM_ASM_000160